MTRRIAADLHMKRLEQIPPGELITAPELVKLWGVSTVNTTIRYLLNRGLLRYRKLERRWSQHPAYAYYRE